jgi:tRNA (guanine37-N1)-methyltransferase
MKIDILTIFPEMFKPLEQSIIGKAQERQLVTIETSDFRENADNKQRHVDDMPYGGGQGMLLMPQPIFATMDKIPRQPDARVLLLDPAGETFDQKKAEELSAVSQLIFICGHYEGFDARITTLATDTLSLGDFVLTGGEMAALAMIDAIVRLLPGVLGKESSHQDESFSSGLLEYPQYTRPENFRGLSVPEVLMSGHHENIRKWRLEESLKRTLEQRPDLLEEAELSDEARKMLENLRNIGKVTENLL